MREIYLWFLLGWTGVLYLYPVNDFQGGRFSGGGYVTLFFVHWFLLLTLLHHYTIAAMATFLYYLCVVGLVLPLCFVSVAVLYFENERNREIRLQKRANISLSAMSDIDV